MTIRDRKHVTRCRETTKHDVHPYVYRRQMDLAHGDIAVSLEQSWRSVERFCLVEAGGAHRYV